MFDESLRNLKDDLFDPISRAVPAFITPLQLTAAAFVCGIQCCVFTVQGSRALSVFCWFLNRVLDCLDGAVARHRRQQTDLGGFLDLLGDFIVYSLIPISCALGREGSDCAMVAVSLLEASFHINNFVLFYIAAVVEKKKLHGDGHIQALTSVTMQPALIEGTESAIFFSLMLLLPNHICIISYCMLGAVLIGISQRVYWATTALSKRRE